MLPSPVCLSLVKVMTMNICVNRMPRWSKLHRTLLPGEHNSLLMQLISVTVFISVWGDSFISAYLSWNCNQEWQHGGNISVYINKVYWSNISLLLRNMKVNFCVHTSKPFSPILSHYKPVHFFTSYFSKVQYNIFVSSDFLPTRFMTNIFMHFSLFTGKKLCIISFCTLPKYLDSIIR